MRRPELTARGSKLRFNADRRLARLASRAQRFNVPTVVDERHHDIAGLHRPSAE
jgi:hypothetical protein